MVNVLKKIPLRKAVHEKGKSICIMSAVFFTTVLFVTVFSTLFFILDAGEEMMRASSPMLMDAAFSVTEEEYEKIAANPLVAEAGRAVRLGIMQELSGAGGIQLYCFEDQMARWMRYYPDEGRMPQKGHEIVVSDQYLSECGITYEEGAFVELAYYIEDRKYTDTFTVVGMYRMSGQPLHVVLTSEDFCQEVYRELKLRGIGQEEGTSIMAGLMFASRGNVRRPASMLIAEEGLDLEEGEYILNDVSLMDSMDVSSWLAVFALLAFVMMTGYLFISNIFQIAISGEVRFYGKLSACGVTKQEITKIIRRENNVLFLLAVVPSLLIGYLFSSAILPGILSAYTTIQVGKSGNVWIFVLSFVFSFLTVKVSERKSVRLAKNSPPIEMKKYTGKYRRVKKADNGNCLTKFALRHFKSDKKKVWKVCVSVALSIFLTSAFYTMAAGFDVQAYVKEELDEDFILAKRAIFTNPNVNSVSYPKTNREEIAPFQKLPGIEKEGGGSLSLVCLRPSDEVWNHFVQIAGEDSYSTPGEMYTPVYGLDDILLEKLKPVAGEIDLDLFHMGNYVLLDAIMSMNDSNPDNEACYQPGDEVTVPFRSGEEGTYTVMAVVEGLPYSVDFPGRYAASRLYLPMKEWQEKENRTDYYLYAFNVAEEFHDLWEETLKEKTAEGLLSYKSKRTVAKEAENYTKGLRLAGIVLGIIFLSMGILNFINCMTGGIYSRKREFAIFRSMGMEEREIEKSLAGEGLMYMAGGFVPGVILSAPGVYVLIEKLLGEPAISYHFYPQVYISFAAAGVLAAIFVPFVSYKKMDRRENFLQQIRSCRE